MDTPYWFGERIGHADIAVACVLRFAGEAHPALFPAARYPALSAHERGLRSAAGVSRNRATAAAAEGVSDAAFFPSPLVGEGGARSATDEGSLSARSVLAERTPHPARTRFAHSCHPLPQGEREEIAQLICPSGRFSAPLSSPLRKNILFYRSANQSYIPPVPSHRGALARSSRTRGGMRWTRGGAFDDGADLADGEVVWSWRLDAGVKSRGAILRAMETNKPDLQGEHEGNR